MQGVVLMEENSIKELLYRINVNSEYDIRLLEDAFKEVLYIENNNIRDTMLGSLLTALMVKGVKVDEIVALLNVAFKMDNYDPKNRNKVELLDDKRSITLVGSGKKGKKTINVSTASALLAASMGAYVVKSGSSSTSSMTGAADFMELVGVNFDLETEKNIEILKKCGFAFFKIENIIPKFDSVYGGNFYVPHVLSFGLAALICPVKTDSILYGLSHPNVELSLEVLKKFGVEDALIVSSSSDNIHFIDEIGILGKTKMIRSNVTLSIFSPQQQFNLPKYTYDDIKQGNDREENVKYILNVLNGTGKMAHEDIVCINCANILYLSNMVSNLFDGYNLSKSAIKTGRALEKLEEYIELTGGNTDNMKKILRR